MSKNYFPSHQTPFPISQNHFHHTQPPNHKPNTNQPIKQHSTIDRQVEDAIKKEPSPLKGKENKQKFGLKIRENKQKIGTNVKTNSELKEISKEQIRSKSLLSKTYQSQHSQTKKGESNELKKKQNSEDASRKCVESKKQTKCMPLGDNKKEQIIVINDDRIGKKFSQIFRFKNEIKAKKVQNLQKTTKQCHYEESKGKGKELKSPYNKYQHKQQVNKIQKQTSNKPKHSISKVKKDKKDKKYEKDNNKGTKFLKDKKKQLKSHKGSNGKQQQIEEKVKFIYHVVIPSKNTHQPNILKIQEESAKSFRAAPSPSKLKSQNLSESQQEYPQPLKLAQKLNSREEQKERKIKKFEIVLSRLMKEIEEKAGVQQKVFFPQAQQTFGCDKSFTQVSPIMAKFAIMVDKKDFHDLPLQQNDNQRSIFSSTVFENSQIKQIAPNLNYSYDQVYEQLFKVMTSTIRPKKILYKIQQEPEQTDQIKQMILMEKIQKQKLEKVQLRVEEEQVLKLNQIKKSQCEEKLKQKQYEFEKVLLQKSSKKEEIGDDRQEMQKLNSLLQQSHSVKQTLAIGQFLPEKSVSIKQEEDSRRSFLKTYTNPNIMNFQYKNQFANQNQISSSFCMAKIENQSVSDKKSEGSQDNSSNSLKIYEPRLKNNSQLLK